MRVPVIVGVLALVGLCSSSYYTSPFFNVAQAAQVQPAQPTSSAAFARVYKSGTAGLVDPTPIRRASPLYTPQAMRAKVQGRVELEVTVDANGGVRDAMVTKSLDTAFGMDDEAVKAAAQWIFQPGRLNGTAVPVRMVVGFDLALH